MLLTPKICRSQELSRSVLTNYIFPELDQDSGKLWESWNKRFDVLCPVLTAQRKNIGVPPVYIDRRPCLLFCQEGTRMVRKHSLKERWIKVKIKSRFVGRGDRT